VAENTQSTNSPDDASVESAEGGFADEPGEMPPQNSESSGADSQPDPLVVQRDEYHRKWLLAVADFENYRRRMQKEIDQERRYAAMPLARDLLPALDNLRRAIEASKSANDLGQLAQGVEMVARQFDDIFGRHGVTPIVAVGQPFDPNRHQALQQMPAPDKPPLTVLAECERGYMLHERVVRPSTVIVSSPDQPASAQAESA
jgi:molecular chaperone GrpE